jgi:hypothetical protein
MGVVDFGFEGIPGVNVEVDSEGKAEDSEEDVEPKHVLRTEDGTPGPKALLLELGVCVIRIRTGKLSITDSHHISQPEMDLGLGVLFAAAADVLIVLTSRIPLHSRTRETFFKINMDLNAFTDIPISVGPRSRSHRRTRSSEHLRRRHLGLSVPNCLPPVKIHIDW